MAALSLQSTQAARPVSILADEFALRLSAFNDLTRDIRSAGIAVKHLLLLDNAIYIEGPRVELFMRHFEHELRGVRHSTAGRLTCHCVKVRGVNVAWYSRVKEQDQ